MSLVLPAPVNVPTDEVLPAGSTNGTVVVENEGGDEVELSESDKLKKNIIFPPPEIRSECNRQDSYFITRLH